MARSRATTEARDQCASAGQDQPFSCSSQMKCPALGTTRRAYGKHRCHSREPSRGTKSPCPCQIRTGAPYARAAARQSRSRSDAITAFDRNHRGRAPGTPNHAPARRRWESRAPGVRPRSGENIKVVPSSAVARRVGLSVTPVIEQLKKLRAQGDIRAAHSVGLRTCAFVSVETGGPAAEAVFVKRRNFSSFRKETQTVPVPATG